MAADKTTQFANVQTRGQEKVTAEIVITIGFQNEGGTYIKSQEVVITKVGSKNGLSCNVKRFGQSVGECLNVWCICNYRYLVSGI